jgi:predicted RND superfamily exporter protein
MKHSRRNTPFSLLSFQDIITGLCGIIILFVLIMLVDLLMKRDRSTATVEEQNIELHDRTAELRKEIATLKEELSKVKESVKAVIVASKDKAAPEVVAKLDKDLTDKERKVAALVSQVADLRTRVAVAKDADAENRKKVRDMEETRRLLENKLAALKDKKGVTLIPERGEFKAPVYLVIGRGGVELLRPLKKDIYRKWFFFDGVKEGLTQELIKLDYTTHTVILLVRPSGIKWMQTIADLIRGLGLSYGRDPLEEDVEVSLAKTNGGDL